MGVQATLPLPHTDNAAFAFNHRMIPILGQRMNCVDIYLQRNTFGARADHLHIVYRHQDFRLTDAGKVIHEKQGYNGA